MDIPTRLRNAIQALGISITEAAERSGIPYRSWQNYLSGEREPKASALSQICTRLGISGGWLLTGMGEMLVAQESKETDQATPETRHEATMLSIYRELGEDERREIRALAESKKRIADLEKQVREMRAEIGKKTVA